MLFFLHLSYGVNAGGGSQVKSQGAFIEGLAKLLGLWYNNLENLPWEYICWNHWLYRHTFRTDCFNLTLDRMTKKIPWCRRVYILIGFSQTSSHGSTFYETDGKNCCRPSITILATTNIFMAFTICPELSCYFG